TFEKKAATPFVRRTGSPNRHRGRLSSVLFLCGGDERVGIRRREFFVLVAADVRGVLDPLRLAPPDQETRRVRVAPFLYQLDQRRRVRIRRVVLVLGVLVIFFPIRGD